MKSIKLGSFFLLLLMAAPLSCYSQSCGSWGIDVEDSKEKIQSNGFNIEEEKGAFLSFWPKDRTEIRCYFKSSFGLVLQETYGFYESEKRAQKAKGSIIRKLKENGGVEKNNGIREGIYMKSRDTIIEIKTIGSTLLMKATPHKKF